MANLIKLQDLTPEVFYKQSRDFQYIGRLFDVVLNHIKLNSELVESCPLSDNSEEKLLDLMAMTLGFKAKHQYNASQLKAVCSAFIEIIRHKGSLYAIETTINALLHAEGIKDYAEVTHDESTHSVSIFIPADMTDLNLLRDILDYILPAGLKVSLVSENKLVESADTDIKYTGSVKVSMPKKKDGQTAPGIDTNDKIYISDLSIIPKVEDINKYNSTTQKLDQDIFESTTKGLFTGTDVDVREN